MIFLQDIDECDAEDNSPCKENAACINNIGSFICKCLDGFEMSDSKDQCIGEG